MSKSKMFSFQNLSGKKPADQQSERTMVVGDQCPYCGDIRQSTDPSCRYCVKPTPPPPPVKPRTHVSDRTPSRDPLYVDDATYWWDVLMRK
jgi:hypothetical protein